MRDCDFCHRKDCKLLLEVVRVDRTIKRVCFKCLEKQLEAIEEYAAWRGRARLGKARDWVGPGNRLHLMDKRAGKPDTKRQR